MKNILEDKKYIYILSLILSCLIEAYIVLIENENLVFNFSVHDFINLFSFKEFIIFFIIFLIIFYILFDKNRKVSVLNFIYHYRLHLSVLIVLVAVVFQIHGSSINVLNLFGVNHKTLVGVSRPIRTDEYVVNTPFAFSQYLNDFAYFSDIVRGSLTDMFIIYGQPVYDVAMIFRPFLIGYLFLNQGQGLSFFWIGRLVFLFLISFEFGMLLTNKNKTLSLAYCLLITFSPVVQWWFAINGLVEQLIFGQLGVLLIYWYMLCDDYKKRFFIAFGLIICVGTFLLVFYPSWQIPFAYVFILLALWIILKNRQYFSFGKKDILIMIICLSVFAIIMLHILSNSLDTIKIILNTAYPGSQIFNGEGRATAFLYYIPSIFFPLNPNNLTLNVCTYSVFADLFPVPLILSGIVIFYQKTKDKLLIGMLILYLLFVIFYLIHLPDLIVNLTFRGTTKTSRLPPVITFIGCLILIRSVSDLKDLNNKKFIIILSLILSVIMVYLSTFEFGNYYLMWMPLLAIVFYFILFLSSFNAFSKRNQKIFLICVISLSFLTGGLVNPIDHGTDVVFESDHFHHVEKIVKNDSDAIWIVNEEDHHINNIFIAAGAKTINSVNTYPDLDKWHKLDVDKQYEDIYNRYAHIYVEIQDKNDTNFELIQDDYFKLNLNVNDLEKLNVSYIQSNKNLNVLSNDKVEFEKLYQDNQYRIYKVNYN